MSDEFDDLMAGIDDTETAPSKPVKKAPAKRKAPARKAPTAAEKIAEFEDQIQAEKDKAVEAAVEKAADTKLPNQGPKETWPVIEIDEVKGSPGFEFVSLNGIAFQIKRGEPVAVPPSILKVLQEAVSARIVQRRDPETGGMINKLQRFSTVPYRIVKWNK